MKVNTAKLKEYVDAKYGVAGIEALEQVLKYVQRKQKWILFMCRTCSDKFSTREECKDHLEQAHVAEFKTCDNKYMPQRISEECAHEISVGRWEPLDAVDAVRTMKNRTDWRVAEDEERKTLLKEIRALLVAFIEHKVLSKTALHWMMQFVISKFQNLGVSSQKLSDCGLRESPQSICFLDSGGLNKILIFLRDIVCTRDDGTDLVCRVVDSSWETCRVKEKINFDSDFTWMLLDRRLLQKVQLQRFDDDGFVKILDPTVYYRNVGAQSHHEDDMLLTWNIDYFPREEEELVFPDAISLHKFDIWVALLKAVQFNSRILGAKYAKKLPLLAYASALTEASELCNNLPKHPQKAYASLLCDRCEKSDTSKSFLCAVRDVLKGRKTGTRFDRQDCLNIIRDRAVLVTDNAVVESIPQLESMVKKKVALTDAKMLLIEKSRFNLLNHLTRLASFDYRAYIRRPLKKFLLATLRGEV